MLATVQVPSDPRLTCTLIGNASTRRLAKVAKLGSDQGHRSNRYRRFLPHAASAAVGFALQPSDALAPTGEHADGHGGALQSWAHRGTMRMQSGRLPPWSAALGRRLATLGQGMRRNRTSVRYLFRI